MLVRDASQIVVFGSASAGFEGSNSDIDLLCVGRGKRFKSADLDIVWKSEAELHHRRWLGSELGNHVARYGVWIWGQDNWSTSARISRQAIAFKRRLISARARSLEAAWPALGVTYRQKHVVKLRRDLQRLNYLIQREAVPATPTLDREWKRIENDESRVANGLKSVGANDLVTRKQSQLFQTYWKCLTPPPAGKGGGRRRRQSHKAPEAQ